MENDNMALGNQKEDVNKLASECFAHITEGEFDALKNKIQNYGADPSHKREGITLLDLAILQYGFFGRTCKKETEDRFKIVKYLLMNPKVDVNHGAEVISGENFFLQVKPKDTALGIAIKLGYKEVVALFLDYLQQEKSFLKLDANSEGKTPKALAEDTGKNEIIELVGEIYRQNKEKEAMDEAVDTDTTDTDIDTDGEGDDWARDKKQLTEGLKNLTVIQNDGGDEQNASEPTVSNLPSP